MAAININAKRRPSCSKWKILLLATAAALIPISILQIAQPVHNFEFESVSSSQQTTTGEDIEKKGHYDPELVTTNKTNPSVAQNSTNRTGKKTNYSKSVAELLHELTASIEQIQDENRRRHIKLMCTWQIRR